MTVNKTRLNGYNQKKSLSVFDANHISYTDLIADSGSGTIFFVMPKHCIILHVLIIEEETTSPGAKLTVTVGGIVVVNSAALDANDLITPPQLTNIHVENGGDVILKQGSNAPSAGVFTISIAYLEHDKNTGEYTNFSDN